MRSRLAVSLLVVAATLGPGCTCGGGKGLPPEAVQDFGDTQLAPPDTSQAASYLALARSIVSHHGRTSVPAAPGRRVMLGGYRPGGDTAVATASGATLADAVATAAEALAGQLGTADPATVRLELDVPTALATADVTRDEELTLASVGLEGVFVTADAGKAGVVLPAEIVERRMGLQGKTSGLAHAKLAPLLASRAGVPEAGLATMRAYRFRTAAFVESSSHDAVFPVLRGMVEPPAEVTPDRLLVGVRRGADYLVRVLKPGGRYVYMYHPLEEHEDTSYGLLRHAGATYALFEAYEEFGTPAYLEKGELALRYLKSRLREDPASQGLYLLDGGDEEQQKVGGAGLSLVAFAKHAAVSGSRAELETMRALARLIMKQQYEDGHFRSNADLERETGKKLKREVIYYVGEAILGLLRLYALDPQQTYLDAARHASDWVVHVRDAYVSEDNQEHDHWMSYAMNELYRVTRDHTYVDFAYKVARAIEKKQRTAADAPAPDFVGTFYDGETTPASTRLEAYDADISLARFAAEPEPWLLGPAREVARSTLAQQYDAENDYWLRNPARADGGVRESLFVPDVRIDYVQHAMSAWLHLARILRDPAYGKTGIPCQDLPRAPSGP